MVIWLTGQPGSGKTTLSLEIKKHFPQIVILDGDRLRRTHKNKDYSRKGREKNIRYAQGIARSSAEFDFDVVVALVAPYRELRESFKKELNVHEFYLVSKRDLRKQFHTGEYEEPLDNFTLVDTDKSIDECVELILSKI